MSAKVLILGCGPAGLIAAHSAAMQGADVRIFSKPRKSFMNGAQYLHQPIPGVPSGDEFEISYQMMGTPEKYRLKVYGPKWDGTVSPEDLEESHSAWDIRLSYDWLWETYGNYVSEWEASPSTLRGLLQYWQPDLVVNSVPRHLLCAASHGFTSATIHSTNISMWGLDDNTVLCNGEQAPTWYRASKIQGYENTEWSGLGVRPPVTPMWSVAKPLGHNCDCMDTLMADFEKTKFLAVGRYGKWTKGTLSHEGYEEVQTCLGSIPTLP